MKGDEMMRELAKRQLGYVALRQARQLGLRPAEVARLTDRGWTRATDRVLRLDGVPDLRGQRLELAVLDVGGAAAVSHEAGAWWWGVPGFSARKIDVVTTTHTTRPCSVARIRQVRRVPEDWVTVLRGVRVARPELIALHLCADLHPDRAARALDNMWRDRLLTGVSIDRLLADLGRRGRDGVATLRELRALREGDYVPPDSNLEARALDVLGVLGLEFLRQVDVGEATHWTGRVDLRARRLPLVVEVQSEKFHTALLDVEHDCRRRQQLEADGFVVVEVWDTELWTSPDLVRDRVGAAARSLRTSRSVNRGVTPA